MKFKKIITGGLEKCYSASSLYINGKQKFLFASEVEAEGIVLDFPFGKRTFPTPGGVMAMGMWPGTSGGFASVYGFYPPFMASDSGLLLTVLGKDGSYVSNKILELPYLHRFEVVRTENRNWLILAVLCREKREKDDWSSPGYVAILPIEDDGRVREVSPMILLDGQFRNHGMWKGVINGRISVITTSDQGAYAVYPADREEGWTVERLLEEPCGEAVMYDIDGDGEQELVAISPFHGSNLSVYKKFRQSEGKWQKIWCYPHPLEFAHSLWAGAFHGKRVIFCGHRKGNGNLLAIWVKDRQWHTSVVDNQVGSSNICVASVSGEQYLLSANHGKGQYAVYQMVNDL